MHQTHKGRPAEEILRASVSEIRQWLATAFSVSHRVRTQLRYFTRPARNSFVERSWRVRNGGHCPIAPSFMTSRKLVVEHAVVQAHLIRTKHLSKGPFEDTLDIIICYDQNSLWLIGRFHMSILFYCSHFGSCTDEMFSGWMAHLLLFYASAFNTSYAVVISIISKVNCADGTQCLRAGHFVGSCWLTPVLFGLFYTQTLRSLNAEAAQAGIYAYCYFV